MQKSLQVTFATHGTIYSLVENDIRKYTLKYLHVRDVLMYGNIKLYHSVLLS